MQSPIAQAIQQICDEKGLSYQTVLDTINAALAAAYRKDFGEKNQNVQVDFNPDTGEMKATDVKVVVEEIDLEAETALFETAKEKREAKIQEALALGKNPDEMEFEPLPKRFNPKTEIMITEAHVKHPELALGDIWKEPLEIPTAFGRMAAQTAKQVIIQKLREAEREQVFGEFKGKEGELVIGTIGRREGRTILVDLGKATAVLMSEDQIENERYYPGQKIKAYVSSVAMTPKGPEIRVSRSHPQMVAKIFNMEVPEISNGLVEIKDIAREAGSRSKVAVETTQDNIDPIGSCIGQRGTRIQTIISELGGEKIDIVLYSGNPVQYITQAISPAKVLKVELHEEEKVAQVMVAADQYSLAIGKGGQNVRLASKLTGWKLNVEQINAPVIETAVSEEKPAETTPAEDVAEEAKN
ncbi:MAG: transcription termination/antitermination protein NusA [Candidatus Magasanikbacteria bacterium]|nr:transcription termination/antitermination protein NusA [Candidatus Magasanikbacteria bacterium]